MNEISMIETLRCAALIAPGAIKDDLALVIAEVTHAIDLFAIYPDASNLREITKHWAHGVRLMDKAEQLRKESLACATNASPTTS